MNNKKKLKQFMICLCCVFCSTALTIPYLSYATTQDDLDNANRELESLKAQQQSLSADLSEIDSQLQSAGSRLSSLEEQIDDKQADVDALNEELLSLSQTMDEQYDSMKLRIRYMYERSSSDVIELLLTSQSMSELLLKSEYIYQLSQYDRDMLDEMEANYERQQAAKEQLDTEVSELSSLREAALNEQENLKTLLAKTQQDFDTSSNNVSEAEAAALAYEKKLEEEIEKPAKSWHRNAQKPRPQAARLPPQGIIIPAAVTLLLILIKHRFHMTPLTLPCLPQLSNVKRATSLTRVS